MLLTQAVDLLCMATRANGLSERTEENYREKAQYLVHFLGDVEVESITVDDLRRWVVSLRDSDLSPFTVRSYVRHVKRVFNFLEDEGRLEVNPAKGIKLSKATKNKRTRAISDEDILALLEATEGDRNIDQRDKAIILLLADSGCRAGGVCGLRLEDLDLEQKEAFVVEKGEAGSYIMFTDVTAQAILDWLAVRPGGKGEWLFVSFGSKNALSTNTLRQMLIRRGRKAGVTGPHNPHAFRHAFAINYLMNGGDLASLADILGHSDVEVTRRYYSRFTRRQLREKHARHSPIAQMFGNEDKV